MYQMPWTPIAPPQMKLDTNGSPSQYEASQSAINHGHPIPMGVHGCCNYGYAPTYFNPPYPHYPPPPPFYYHGAYPSFTPMYPVYYPPPPHYPIDQPRYEFDKNQFTDHHCCGCPNHHYIKKDDEQHVKIEPQKPETERASASSLVPVEPKSHSYPLACVPQGSARTTKELGNPIEPDLKQNPCDLRLKDNVQTIGKSGQNKNVGDGNQFPFPIFWVPSKGSEKGEKHPKELDLSGTKSNNSAIEPNENEGRVGIGADPEEMGKKNINWKLIPVKQLGENEKDNGIIKEKGEKENKLKSIPVKQMGENGDRKGKETVEKSSGNVTKAKLPPVCLRVEPLRKKKNGSNGNSRSPSPKRSENKSPSCTQNEKSEVKSTEKEREEIKTVDGKPKENNIEDEKVEDLGTVNFKENQERRAVEAKKSEVTNMSEKKIKEETNILEKMEKGMEKEEISISENMEKLKCDLEEKIKKKFSEIEAAVIIQSAYRGFEVRRWDTLKKLKQIGEVRDRMAEVKSRIEALEASSDGSSYEKQRVVIGEIIMSLLLKLDAIQGLYPALREIRKSVAKELVSLQDKLDSLGRQHESEAGHDSSGENSQAIVPEKLDKEACEEARNGSEQPKVEVGHENSGENSQAIVPEKLEKEASEELEKETCEGARDGSEQPAVEVGHENSGENSQAIVPEKEACEELEKDACEGARDGIEQHKIEVSHESSSENSQVIIPKEIEKEVCEEARDLNEQHKAEAGHENSGENSQATIPEEVENEVCEEARDGTKPVSSLCESNEGEVSKEEIPSSDSVNLNDDKEQSVKPINEIRDDLCNDTTMTKINDSESELDADFVSDAKVPSFAGEASANHERLYDGESSIEQEKPHEHISTEIQGDLQGGNVKSPSTDATQELHELLDECKGSSSGEDMEDESKHERVEEKSPGEEQEKECGSQYDNATRSNTDDDNTEKQGVYVQGDQEREGANIDRDMDLSYALPIESEQSHSEPIEKHVVDIKGGEREALENKHVSQTPQLQKDEHVELIEDVKLGNQVEIGNDKLVEENEKLREMVAKLVEAGKEQLSVISSLSGRVKDLETKLVKNNNKKPKMRRIRVGSCANRS